LKSEIGGTSKMKTGITFYIGQKDYFIITDQKNRTIPFAIRVLKALKLPPTNQNAKELVQRMGRAKLNEWETTTGIPWYEISGDRIHIAAPKSDPNTVIMALN